MPHGLNIVFALGMRVASMVLLAVLLYEMMRVQNGRTLGRLRGVFGALAVGIAWYLLATLEELTDFLPGVNLRALAYEYSWVPNGVLAVALWRLLRAL